jgi:hypothetical protein
MHAPQLHLFRRAPKPDLYCLVSQNAALPGFISGTGWEYAGTFQGLADIPQCRAERPAREAVEKLGYYVFQAVPKREQAGANG